MKIITIVGARPQFIKAAAISRAIKSVDEVREVIVHTGQHYDPIISEKLFTELNIPHPDINLEIGACSQGRQIARMIESIEEVLFTEHPDWVLVYGDSNSTLAGALAAAKLNIPVAHIEAGLRSFNRTISEEINRITTDHIAHRLFAPTQNALNMLVREGLAERSFFSGDVMLDSLLYYKKFAQKKCKLEVIADVNPGEYYLATIDKQENTDVIENLQSIFLALSELDLPVIVPLHPRTQKLMDDITFRSNVRIIPPLGYLEMLTLLSNCNKVFTDSGGVQKEAYFLHKPCITLRDETEWVETLEGNWNFVVGANKLKILEKAYITDFGIQQNAYGDGKAAEKILNTLLGKS